MESMLRADIFLVVTIIATVLLFLLFILALFSFFYFLKIVRNFYKISKILRSYTENIDGGLKALGEKIKKNPLFVFLFGGEKVVKKTKEKSKK